MHTCGMARHGSGQAGYGTKLAASQAGEIMACGASVRHWQEVIRQAELRMLCAVLAVPILNEL